MSFTRTAMALATAALLASCGGGATPADNAQAFGAELRLRAQAASTSRTHTHASGAVGATGAAPVEYAAAGTVSPTEAAEQLMDFGESVFKAYFPVHGSTQTLEPFRYRYYAATGIYLGVVVQAGMGYTLNGVYVMGGPFGNDPVYVGLLTDFITPQVPDDTGPGPNAANNGCFDMSLAEATGLRRQISYDTLSMGKSSVTDYDETFNGLVAFEGQQRRERLLKVSSSLVGGATVDVNDIRFYYLKTGPAEITHYGQTLDVETSSSTAGVSSSTKTVSKNVYNPAWVDRQYALGLGESLTQTVKSVSTATSTTTITATGMPPNVTTTNSGPTSSSSTDTITYVRRESVTVPAGTFATCLYEEVNAATPTVKVSTWTIVGSGIMVQTLSSDNSLNFKARSIKVNGQPVTN